MEPSFERLSIFDIFKIGVGPSSSHTLGPWEAGRKFADELNGAHIVSLRVRLFGSLSKTGKGHATDVAVMLGLSGYDPVTIDTGSIDGLVQDIRSSGVISVKHQAIPFSPDRDIVFESYAHTGHPNTLTFEAYTEDGVLITGTWYSIGGGFITKQGEEYYVASDVDLPYPIDSGKDLLRHCDETGKSIAEIVWANEVKFNREEEVLSKIKAIHLEMMRAVYRGCNTDGVLPGGLNVQRRARSMYLKLFPGREYSGVKSWVANIQATGRDFGNINQWVSCFALAVNEENAALGRIVTSPTNGAAGVIPAVLLYHTCFCDCDADRHVRDFLLTAGEIGCIFKKRATISAAMGGCQAEIGVSSAMAAGGLTAIQGGSPRQALMAAEIAMEHHLGLTCDPIAGLVQIPCIERNAMGAMKAITASTLALAGNPSHAKIDFDTVVKTMWETAKDMHNNYKETADGGLAIALPVVIPEC